MTVTETGIITESRTLSFTFDTEGSSLDIETLTDCVDSARALLVFSYIANLNSLPKTRGRPKWFTVSDQVSATISEDFPIVRISYNSPLEIVFWVAGGGATGLAFRFSKMATKALEIYERYQMARLKKSEVEVKILRNQVLSSEIRHIQSMQADAHFRERGIPSNQLDIDKLSDRTMVALRMIDQLKIEE